MKRICIAQCARLGSTRIPNKLLEKIGNKTLLEIGLRKMTDLQSLTGATSLLCVHESETVLIEAANKYGVEVFLREKISVTQENYNLCFAGWKGRLRDRFDWMLDINLLCRPFLNMSTIEKMVQEAHSKEHPFVTVVEKRGILWNFAGRCILGEGETANTRENPKYFELAHVGYGMPISYVGDEYQLTRELRTLVLDLDEEEKIDIDTPEQLEFARKVRYAGQRYKEDYV